MGVINMMIVIPMLLETLTFGLIYATVLRDNPTNALMFAGGLLFLAALAMLWIKPPPPREEEEAAEMPPVEVTAPAIGP
jgi:maltose/moltooligosaccharide transporter